MKQWGATPGTAGSIRDFYRLAEPGPNDPLLAEKYLSQIEDTVAPILRSIDQERREPLVEELEPLLYFIAIQWARVPAFRLLVFGVFEKLTSEQVSKALESEETWVRTLKEAGMSPDDEGADYKEMKDAVESKAFKLNASPDWYVQQAFRAVDSIMPGLLKRRWYSSISPSGSFIVSDNPVILDGQNRRLVGFENAEIVTYAVSRHVRLWGTLDKMPPPLVNRYLIATANTLALLRVEDQVFSHIPDFCWMDENRKYQTHWKLFSKDKILKSCATE
jgi:hypothetical protein